MNMIKIAKISLVVLRGLLMLGAIGVLGYYLGWKKIEANLIRKGFNIAVSQIVSSVEKTGQIQINDFILIVK